MSQSTHRLLCPVRGLPGVVQKFSTLFPIVGRGKKDKTLAEKALWVRKLWQRRVYELDPLIQIPLKKLSLCQPAFCYTSGYTYTCKRANLCPFCYARRVAELFEQVNLACQAGGYKFLLRNLRRGYPCEFLGELPTVIGESLGKLNKRYRRRNIIRMLNPAGSIVWNLFAPYSETHIMLHAHQLYIYRATQSIPEKLLVREYTSDTILQCRSEDRTIFAGHLSKCFEYPASLLYGPAAVVAGIMEATSRSRVLATTGIMRNKQA